MQEETNGNNWGNSTTLFLGIAAGTAIGIGIALSRRKKSRWDSARQLGKRIGSRSDELSDAASDMVGRVKVICDQARKLVDDAGELWANGRKLAGY
jgi:hypothetical protein